MSKYSMVISWSEEDQAYIVSVPGLPGCMADGKTPTEAVENWLLIYRIKDDELILDRTGSTLLPSEK